MADCEKERKRHAQKEIVHINAIIGMQEERIKLQDRLIEAEESNGQHERTILRLTRIILKLKAKNMKTEESL
jgi:hypothetical protein